MSSDCVKCRLSKKDGLFGCEGLCGKRFRIGCTGLTNSDFKMLEILKILFYLCDNCRRFCEGVDKTELAKFKRSVRHLR